MLRTLIVLTLILLTGCRSQEAATAFTEPTTQFASPLSEAHARIESYSDDLSTYWSVLYVRLTNNLGVGAFYPTELHLSESVQIHACAMGEWHVVKTEDDATPDETRGVWLEPGDSVLCAIPLARAVGLERFDQLKVIADDRVWLTADTSDFQAPMKFETQAYPIFMARTIYRSAERKLPAPAVLPAFDPVGTIGPNGNEVMTRFVRLWHSNVNIARQLDLYSDATALPKLERIIREDRDPHMRLFAASIAVARGSELARQEIVRASRSATPAVASSAADAINMLFSDSPSPWLEQAGRELLARAKAISERQQRELETWDPSDGRPFVDQSIDCSGLETMFGNDSETERRDRDRPLQGESLESLARILMKPNLDARDAVWELRWRHDPETIPLLHQAARRSKNGAVINQAVEALSDFSDPRATEALIDCFDIDFTGKDDWKRAYNQQTFTHNVARALRTITGQSIGDRKESWQRWWNEQGRREWTGKE